MKLSLKIINWYIYVKLNSRLLKYYFLPVKKAVKNLIDFLQKKL